MVMYDGRLPNRSVSHPVLRQLLPGGRDRVHGEGDGIIPDHGHGDFL